MKRQPHILILMPDQQRADCLSCAGHPVLQTPNMDRLAREGIRFSNTYTTCPLCMPARSSFLSGLYCHNHGQWNNVGRLPEGSDTFLHHLKQVGYHTCHIGKSHLHPHVPGRHLDEAKPFMHRLGWDDVLETTGPHATKRCESIMTDHWREIGCLDTFREDYARRDKLPSPRATWPSPMPEGETLDDFVGRTAVDYICKYDTNAPLLLFVGFGGPHEPWDPPPRWAHQYDPAKMDPMKPVTQPGPWVPPAAARHHRALQDPARWNLTSEISGRVRAMYYAKIAHIDWWFGQLLEALQERSMLAETAVIFWSDHGEMLCDKGRLFKSVFYEEAVRVPLIIRPPHAEAPGQVSTSLVSLIDVFPTILDFAGCDPAPGVFGKSLTPLLSDPFRDHHDAVFSEIAAATEGASPMNRVTVRNDRFKMVVNETGEVLKLYDLVEDAEEAANLVGKHEMDQTIRALRDQMLAWYLSSQVRQT